MIQRVRTFFEKVLTDELFQLFSEAPTVDGLVPFTVVVRTILFCSEKCRIIMDLSPSPDYGWSLMALKTSLMRSLSGVKCSVGLKAWSRLGERTGSACLL